MFVSFESILRTTMTWLIVLVCSSALSAISLRLVCLPLLFNPSAVTRSFAPRSLILEERASALKPLKTTVKVTPSLAAARRTTTASGSIGRYTAILSPFFIPKLFFRRKANRLTSRQRS